MSFAKHLGKARLLSRGTYRTQTALRHASRWQLGCENVIDVWMGAAEGSADPSDGAERVTLIGKSEPQLRSLLSLTEQGGAWEDSFLSPEL